MNLRYLLAGVLVVALVALGSFGLAQITGFIVSDGGSREVQVNIDYGENEETFDVEIGPRESAFDSLKRVATVDYEANEMGAYITGINNVKQDENHYWLYFVNDEMPNVGCAYYHPVDGDVIAFRYLTTEEAAGYF
ncbi:MAG: DUF4430 domain-containing protein [Candidatus Aenigmarchaeota archaeon]|nr:DUF4430 domain-containing protein [Candidatus Aenigmarchaeota archaeon]